MTGYMGMYVDPETGLTPIAKEICNQVAAGALPQVAANKARTKLIGTPYKTPNSAASAASQVLTRLNSRLYIAKLAAIANATPIRALERVGKALDAKRTLISPKGDVLGTEDDFNIQLRASDMVFKIHGLYQAPSGEGGLAGDIVDIELDAASGLLADPSTEPGSEPQP